MYKNPKVKVVVPRSKVTGSQTGHVASTTWIAYSGIHKIPKVKVIAPMPIVTGPKIPCSCTSTPQVAYKHKLAMLASIQWTQQHP